MIMNSADRGAVGRWLWVHLLCGVVQKELESVYSNWSERLCPPAFETRHHPSKIDDRRLIASLLSKKPFPFPSKRSGAGMSSFKATSNHESAITGGCPTGDSDPEQAMSLLYEPDGTRNDILLPELDLGRLSWDWSMVYDSAAEAEVETDNTQ